MICKFTVCFANPFYLILFLKFQRMPHIYYVLYWGGFLSFSRFYSYLFSAFNFQTDLFKSSTLPLLTQSSYSNFIFLFKFHIGSTVMCARL